MRRTMCWAPAIVAVSLLCAVASAAAQDRAPGREAIARRLALVVGNDSYKTPLVNARNDARAVAAALKQLPEPFTVTLLEDATLAQLASAIGTFAASLHRDDLAFFYFAGHGIQVSEENYLLPVDYSSASTVEARLRAVPVSSIAEVLRGAGVAVLVLDACRDNPFRGARSAGGGLAVPAARGVLIAYATGAGQTAEDNPEGGNGLFARELVAALGQPGLTLGAIFRRVRTNVRAVTRDRQWPALYNDLVGEIVLRPGSAAGAASDPESVAWEAVAKTTAPAALQQFIQAFPNGAHLGTAHARLADLYRQAAESGDAKAMAALGLVYETGLGVSRDYAQALSWYRKSADAGNAFGAAHLGQMYARGRGVARDDVEAIAWYRKAADAGQPMAMQLLGTMYFEGRGVPLDRVKAFEWFRKGADAGDVAAMTYVGMAYAEGQGVANDDVQAVAWLRKGADGGDEEAMASLGVMYRDGRGVQRDLDQAAAWFRKGASGGSTRAKEGLASLAGEKERPAVSAAPPTSTVNARELRTQAEAADRRGDAAGAFAWYRKAADGGDVEAMRWLGLAYQFGRGTAEDEAQARAWYRKAADNGNAPAMEALGELCETGDWADNDAEALAWFRKAVEAGSADAMRRIAIRYAAGRNVPRDDAQAAAWDRKAAEGGNWVSMASLGWAYEIGLGVTRDDEQAVAWYRKAIAALQGKFLPWGLGSQPPYNLAVMHANGRVAAPDEAEAVALYRRAADGESPDAMWALGSMYASGRGLPRKDDKEAVSWYRKAAEYWKPSRNAMYSLGVMYAEGRGVPRDDRQAASWFRKAADAGVVQAMNKLADLYEAGLGVRKNQKMADTWRRRAAATGANTAGDLATGIAAEERGDYAEAARWYLKAAGAGSAAAMQRLGRMYSLDQGPPGNDWQAFMWFRKAAEAGDVAAMREVAERYEHGAVATRQDLQQAVAWYRKAAAAGDDIATTRLKRLERRR